jgi:hypothetical protein
MRRIVACILMLIYSAFAAGVYWSDQIDQPTLQGERVRIDAAAKETGQTSHFTVPDFHKSHKHLAASRALKVPRTYLQSVSSLFYFFTAFVEDVKKETVIKVAKISQVYLFIKNCVLQI